MYLIVIYCVVVLHQRKSYCISFKLLCFTLMSHLVLYRFILYLLIWYCTPACCDMLCQIAQECIVKNLHLYTRLVKPLRYIPHEKTKVSIKVASYLLIFHFDQLLSLCIWSGQRQDGDGTLHAVVLRQFTMR